MQCKHLSCKAALRLFSSDSTGACYECPLPSIPGHGSDKRDLLLARILEHVAQPGLEPVEANQSKLIHSIVAAILTSNVSSDEIAQFLMLNSEASASIGKASALALTCQIEKLAESMDRVLVISIGAGDAQFEHRVDQSLDSGLAERVRWLLCDPEYSNTLPVVHSIDPIRWRFRPEGFAEITKRQISGYCSDDETPIFFANFSLHHADSLSQNIVRFFSETNFVIVEEPTTATAWSCATHRLVRSAFEVLANVAYQPKWASSFLLNPDAFHFNPVFNTTLAALAAPMISIGNTSPPAVVVSSTVKHSRAAA
jgi:hypothetical protein